MDLKNCSSLIGYKIQGYFKNGKFVICVFTLSYSLKICVILRALGSYFKHTGPKMAAI